MFGLKESVNIPLGFISIGLLQSVNKISFLARKCRPVFGSSASTFLCFAWLKNRLRYDMDESGELELEEFLRMARRRNGRWKTLDVRWLWLEWQSFKNNLLLIAWPTRVREKGSWFAQKSSIGWHIKGTRLTRRIRRDIGHFQGMYEETKSIWGYH